MPIALAPPTVAQRKSSSKGIDDGSRRHPFCRRALVFAASSILKLIPGLGSAVNATVAGTLTAAMGMFVRSNFEAAAIAKVKGLPAPELNFEVELFKKVYDEYKKQK